MTNEQTLSVTHNEAAQQFEIRLGNKVAYLTYVMDGDQIDMNHTLVPPEFEGRGIGGKLAQAALNYARDRSLKVIPSCPFVDAYVRRHPEYEVILA